MELFREDGCLTDEGLQAVVHGGLDELGRLETAEHLSYCDSCMDRYTALLTADVMETPPKTMRSTVMSTIWVRLMQNTYGRVAVATVAAVLALSMWKAGTLEQITNLGSELKTVLPPAQSQPAEQGPGLSKQTLRFAPKAAERLGPQHGRESNYLRNEGIDL